MPSRNWMFRIQDILDAIEVTTKYIEGMTFDEFAGDQRTVDAVVRRLTIIGEASSHIPDSVSKENSDIPWNEMRAMRNFVVHEYFGVSEDILWNTIQIDLQSVIEPLRKLQEKYSTISLAGDMSVISGN
ncbi:MAG: DUF86 domain-containing protein [Candidatus Sabulitectum sp.]|nr:DUF86 domain-containing protein [Candidatus Sabulitectum sp.]